MTARTVIVVSAVWSIGVAAVVRFFRNAGRMGREFDAAAEREWQQIKDSSPCADCLEPWEGK